MSDSKLVLALLVLGTIVIGLVLWRPWVDPTEFLEGVTWRHYFTPEEGWVVLPIPDSKYEPGAIIQVGHAGVRFYGHLQDCHYPREVFEPTVGHRPAIRVREKTHLRASAVAALEGIEVGPRGSRLAVVELTIDSMTSDAFNPLRVAIWEEEADHYDQVPEACRRELNEPGTYVLSEAARMHRARFRLLDSSGAEIRVTSEKVGEFLQFAPTVNAEATVDGELLIDRTVTVAFRRAVPTAAGFKVLGSEDLRGRAADALIDSIYEAQHPAKPDDRGGRNDL